uniref:Uncharacterized protein n=1 Tax=Arundo donax TaxID=35708 RepID=A0A0A9G3L9_ARUDO
MCFFLILMPSFFQDKYS